MTTSVRLATEADFDRITEVVEEAFIHDPVYTYFASLKEVRHICHLTILHKTDPQNPYPLLVDPERQRNKGKEEPKQMGALSTRLVYSFRRSSDCTR